MDLVKSIRHRTHNQGYGLVARVISRQTLLLMGATTLVVVSVLFAITDLRGPANFAFISGLGYLAGQTILSVAVEGRRRAVNRLCTALVSAAFATAALPLLLILSYTVQQGIAVVDWNFLTHSMFRVNPEDPGGGVYHAIVGTLIQVLLATGIATPLGVLAAIFMVEYGRQPSVRTISVFVDVMAGVPSIVAGLFIYTAWILLLGFNKSGLAGAIALAFIMLPVVIRSAEQMLRLVPVELREAAYALGVPKWRTILKVVLPTALGGIVTGVMLGVARIAGETAPLLLLVGINQRIELNPFGGMDRQRPQESLPTLVFEQFSVAAGNTQSPPFQRAWGAAFVLVVIIGLLNLAARFIARFARVRR